MSEQIKVKSIFVFDNGMCAVCGFDNQQIAELQSKWEDSRTLLRQAHVDTSKAEWHMPFDERMKFEAGW